MSDIPPGAAPDSGTQTVEDRMEFMVQYLVRTQGMDEEQARAAVESERERITIATMQGDPGFDPIQFANEIATQPAEGQAEVVDPAGLDAAPAEEVDESLVEVQRQVDEQVTDEGKIAVLEQGIASGEFEGDTLEDLINQSQDLQRRQALESQYSYMATANGYDSVDEMLEVIRGQMARGGQELTNIATALGDLELMQFVTDPNIVASIPGMESVMVDVFRAPIERHQIRFKNESGGIEEFNINASDFDRVVNIAGIDVIQAGAVFRSLGEAGVPATVASRQGALFGLHLQRSGFLDSQRNAEGFLSDPTLFGQSDAPADSGVEGTIGYHAGRLPAQAAEVIKQLVSVGPPEDQNYKPEQGNASLIETLFTNGINAEAKRWKAMVAAYGRPELALVAMADRALADEIYQYGSPQSEISAAKVNDILNTYGPEQLQAAGFATGFDGAMIMENLTSVGGSAARARRSVNVNLPDPEGVKDTMEQLYRSLLLTDPTDSQLAAFAGEIEGLVTSRGAAAANQIAGGSDFNFWQMTGGRIVDDADEAAEIIKQYSTNVQAQALKRIEGTAAYEKLYANRPDGVDPLAYAAAFRSRIERMLGAEDAMFALDAQRVGMQQGDLDTATGRAAFSEAGMKSATLQERWARNANVFKRVI